MKKSAITSLLVVGLMLMAACAKQPPAVDLSPPAFHDKTVIALDVGDIKVVDEYTPPPSRRHVERLFPTTPAQGMKIWVRDRLQANGTPARRLEVVIHEASAVETTLKVRKDLKGAFTKEPNRKYDTVLDVELKIYGADGNLPEAEAKGKVTLSRELLEGANSRDQDALFAAMTRDLLTKMDALLESNIDAYFSRYRVQPTPMEW